MSASRRGMSSALYNNNIIKLESINVTCVAWRIVIVAVLLRDGLLTGNNCRFSNISEQLLSFESQKRNVTVPGNCLMFPSTVIAKLLHCYALVDNQSYRPGTGLSQWRIQSLGVCVACKISRLFLIHNFYPLSIYKCLRR